MRSLELSANLIMMVFFQQCEPQSNFETLFIQTCFLCIRQWGEWYETWRKCRLMMVIHVSWWIITYLQNGLVHMNNIIMYFISIIWWTIHLSKILYTTLFPLCSRRTQMICNFMIDKIESCFPFSFLKSLFRI